MNKFRVASSNGHFTALSLLLILTVFVLSRSSPCRAAVNPTERFQFVSTIELAAPLPSEIKVEDVKFQNVVNMSYILVNEEDSSVQGNIPQGKLQWETNNLTLQSATLNDSLGESFPLLNNSGLIMNPPLEGPIAPNSTYTLSLVMVFMPGALYFDSYKAWEFGTTLKTNVSTVASIIFPINFSVPFIADSPEQSRDQNYKNFTWINSPLQPLTIAAVFLPFPYNPQTIFLNFSNDISSVFPIWGGGTATETQEFTSLSEYNGLVVPPIFEIPVLFPPTSDNSTQVTSVYGPEGPYAKLPERLSEVNYTNSGKYYPDKINQVVYVYPRATSSENLYDYIVTVTFDLGKLLPFNATLKDKLLPPYDTICRNTINLKGSGDWELNLTQGTIVQFSLPQGTQPYERSDYNIHYDSAEGRYSVTFVNATSEWTTGTWEIDFFIVRLYNFFWTEVASIVLLAAVTTAMAVLRKRPLGNTVRKMISYVIPLLTGPGLIAAEWAIAYDWFWDIITQKMILTALLLVQVGLTVVVFLLAQKWKFGQQTTGETSQP